jgi:hypothetical protein
MKRIIGTVVALAAVLAFGTVSSAAPIVFNVSGTGSVNTVSQFAPAPPGYFITPFSPGSSVTVDITGGAATLTTGTLLINAVTPLGALGTIHTDVSVALSGATGALVGDDILWFTPVNAVASGTFDCTGAICGIFGLTQGTLYPIAGLSALTGATPVNPSNLGIWDLNASLDTILGSNRNVITLGGPNPPPGPGLPSQWYLFGSGDLGFVPEPGALVLVALGLGALSLRSRKA